MQTIECKVKSIKPLNDFVFQVLLTPPQPLEFNAGQYLSVVMAEDDKRPFSIASAPGNTDIELHIGASAAESYPMQVIERMQQHDSITIEAPAGNAHIRHDSNHTRILVAGGTGFSYVKSMTEDSIAKNNLQPTIVYWGCKNIEAMYYYEQAQAWQANNPWLTFVPVMEEVAEGVSAEQGLLLDVIAEKHPDMSKLDVYIAGRFEMSAAARDKFTAQGLPVEQLYGDAFAFI
ncbi:NAD(P)H-flavin reductase [Paraferrimonas sp. SM1919]|uniref:NAD(P)H-flavin reductase n=1 Tax=Paraferrimonas sp. SM1919 TaxID=2662263 RepID=UPI0013CF7F11|nr:NAD(P)H-flavin reductase [Paraferrimonas sp. SM1919]